MRPIFTPPYEPKVRSRFTWLFRLASRFLKYYVLGLFGFLVVCLIAAIFGVYSFIQPLMPLLGELLWRLAALALCLLAISIVIESLRQ